MMTAERIKELRVELARALATMPDRGPMAVTELQGVLVRRSYEFYSIMGDDDFTYMEAIDEIIRQMQLIQKGKEILASPRWNKKIAQKEKMAAAAVAAIKPLADLEVRITLAGEEAIVEQGKSRTLVSSEDLFGSVCNVEEDSGLIPVGVKTIYTRGDVMCYVHESQPRCVALRWDENEEEDYDEDSHIQKFSAAQRKQEADTHIVSFPYVVTLVWLKKYQGRYHLQNVEIFFRNEPLNSMDDVLCAPNILNCSPTSGHDSSVMCMGNLIGDLQKAGITDPAEIAKQSVMSFWETRFNWSHGDTWYENYIANHNKFTLSSWEKATAKDSNAGLKMDWKKLLPLNKHLEKFADTMGGALEYQNRPYHSQRIAALVHKGSQKARPRAKSR